MIMIIIETINLRSFSQKHIYIYIYIYDYYKICVAGNIKCVLFHHHIPNQTSGGGSHDHIPIETIESGLKHTPSSPHQRFYQHTENFLTKVSYYFTQKEKRGRGNISAYKERLCFTHQNSQP